MNTEKYNIELTLDELEFLVDLTSVDDSPTGKNLVRYFDRIAWQATYHTIGKGQKDVVQPQEMENNSPSNEPISITQLTSLGGTIEDPIVIYYTAEGKLIPDEEDKREVFICVESVESGLKKYLTEEHRYGITHYDRQVISQRGEYKIVPNGDTDGLMNVILEANNGEFHFFGEAELLLARTEVKDEAIETWFPQSNGGCFRDYPSNSGLDIEAYDGPDSPCESSVLLDVSDAIYIYA